MAQPFAIVQVGARCTRKTGESKRTGKPYDFVEQEVLIEDGRGQRKVMYTTVDSVEKAHQPGEYELDTSYIGFIQGKYREELGFTKIVLAAKRK